MSAHLAHSTLSFVASRTDGRGQSTSASRRSPAARDGTLRRAMQWLVDMPRRRAVINELDSLSDHELADIGLARADVPRVFDRGFAAQRAGN